MCFSEAVLRPSHAVLHGNALLLVEGTRGIGKLLHSKAPAYLRTLFAPPPDAPLLSTADFGLKTETAGKGAGERLTGEFRGVGPLGKSARHFFLCSVSNVLRGSRGAESVRLDVPVADL